MRQDADELSLLDCQLLLESAECSRRANEMQQSLEQLRQAKAFIEKRIAELSGAVTSDNESPSSVEDLLVAKPIHYYGSKFLLRKWIWSHMPPHRHFVDLFLGGGNIWWGKSRSQAETAVDVNGQVFNFFEVLRADPKSLIDLIKRTPWSDHEFEIAKTQTDDPLEDARRFFVLVVMGIGGGVKHDSFRLVKEIGKKNSHFPAHEFMGNFPFLFGIAQRMRGVQLLKCDVFDLLPKFSAATTLLYADPPYLHSVRSSSRYIDDFDVGMHEALAEQLTKTESMVIVSGRSNPLYERWYEDGGFRRVDRPSKTQGKNGVESLWLCPKVVEGMRQMDLFGPAKIA